MRIPRKKRPRGRAWRVRGPVAPHEIRLLPFPNEGVTSPAYRRKTAPGSFRTSFYSEYHYGDGVGYGRVVNPMVGHTSKQPHFLLGDRKKPRVALAYWPHGEKLTITSIQRLRTQYVQRGARYEWSKEKEAASAMDFGKELGMRPSEFVLCEFLHAQRADILAGKPVVLELTIFRDAKDSRKSDYEEKMKIYRPLVERFFVRAPIFRGLSPKDEVVKLVYALNMDKRRVREALGLEK